jgi:hypothetical protein
MSDRDMAAAAAPTTVRRARGVLPCSVGKARPAGPWRAARARQQAENIALPAEKQLKHFFFPFFFFKTDISGKVIHSAFIHLLK